MTTTTRNPWIAATLSTLALLAGCNGVGASGQNEAPTDLSDATAGQALTAVCPGNNELAGIDISYPQDDFDLAGAYANGNRFVYIGATFGITIQQTTYAEDLQHAKDLGMIHGAYHFFVPGDDPNLQADNFLKEIGNSVPKGDLPPALDWEWGPDHTSPEISWGEEFDRVQIFLDRVETATGRTPVIYTYSDFLGATPPSSFSKYPLWISNTGETGSDGPNCPPIPAPWTHWLFYQWDTGDGLDRDRYNGTLADLKTFVNGGTTPAPSDPTPVTQTCTNVAASAEPVLKACDESAIRAIAPSSADAFLDRAFSWVGRCWYSQTDTCGVYPAGQSGDPYRADCSGFVSYIWQVKPSGLGCPNTEGFAGGDLGQGRDLGGEDWPQFSEQIKWDELTPGDALVDLPDHAMLFAGWMNPEHNDFCVVEEYTTGTTATIQTHSVNEWFNSNGTYGQLFTPERKAGYVPTTTTCTNLAGPLDQVENNSSLSALRWSDGHIEMFGRTNSDKALHVWTNQETDTWHSSEDFSGKAECGLASAMSYAGEEHAEVFDPDSAGDVQSTYYLDGWHDFSNFDGHGMTQLTTLRWSDTKARGWTDGRTEVFAHASDDRIYHKYYDPETKSWSGWDNLGGQFITGVSAILNQSGDGMLFATDHDGQAWYNESSKATGEGWKGWKPMGGHLSSRPVVVREGGGTLRVFARGQDGTLYGAHSTEAGFSPFQVIHSNFQVVGEPSATIDNGVVTVFVRGLSGYLSFVTMDAKTHVFSQYTRRGETKFGADPFGWQRPDGRVELFSITDAGHLLSSYHSKTGWTAWKELATGLDSCPPVAVGCPNGDGNYCGGHGVGGSAGSLYTCTNGMLTLDERCSASCQENGSGGEDVCAQPTGCTSNSDCVASMGQYAVCVMPTDFCADPGTQANYCSTDIQAMQDQPCSSNAQCDPAGTGTMACGACVGSCGATSCCEYTGN